MKAKTTVERDISVRVSFESFCPFGLANFQRNTHFDCRSKLVCTTRDKNDCPDFYIYENMHNVLYVMYVYSRTVLCIMIWPSAVP